MGRKGERPKLSVVIPAFNEGAYIKDFIEEIDANLQKMDIPYEVIVVDDGSIDLTGEMAKDEGARVIRNERNLGKGAALRKAFPQARGDFIVTMDANGYYDPREIGIMIKPLERARADVVIGTRFSRDSNIHPYAIGLTKRFGNLFLNLIFNFLAGRRISDSLSGFKAYRRQALEKLTICSNGFGIEPEIAFKSIREGLVFEEVPVTSRTRLGRHLPSFRDGLHIFKEMIRMMALRR